MRIRDVLPDMYLLRRSLGKNGCGVKRRLPPGFRLEQPTVVGQVRERGACAPWRAVRHPNRRLSPWLVVRTGIQHGTLGRVRGWTARFQM